MIPIHGAGFFAMQMRPIARESDEVPHSGVPVPILTVAALPPYDMIAGDNGQFESFFPYLPPAGLHGRGAGRELPGSRADVIRPRRKNRVREAGRENRRLARTLRYPRHHLARGEVRREASHRME